MRLARASPSISLMLFLPNERSVSLVKAEIDAGSTFKLLSSILNFDILTNFSMEFGNASILFPLKSMTSRLISYPKDSGRDAI